VHIFGITVHIVAFTVNTVGLLAAIFQKIKAQKLKETINSFQKEAK
jgi:hypothetical protein